MASWAKNYKIVTLKWPNRYTPKFVLSPYFTLTYVVQSILYLTVVLVLLNSQFAVTLELDENTCSL